jgi:hypothetical protein
LDVRPGAQIRPKGAGTGHYKGTEPGEHDAISFHGLIGTE